MSRIGKKAGPVPTGVTANVEGPDRQGEGPEGRAEARAARRRHRSRWTRADHGRAAQRDQARALACGACRARWSNNLVTGVTKGFEQKLEINGVGYRAAVQGKKLKLALGYSHDVIYPIPEGIEIVDAEADRDRDHRHRQAEGRAGRGRNPRLPPARALQGQGREIRRRIHLPQGRQEEVTEPTMAQVNSADRTAHSARAPRRQGCGAGRRPRLSVFRSASTSMRR